MPHRRVKDMSRRQQKAVMANINKGSNNKYKKYRTPVVKKTKKIIHPDIIDDCYDSHSGQNYCRLIAYDKQGNYVGHLDYSEYNHQLYVDMIEVDEKHQRQGIATDLLLKLKDKRQPIHYGYSTRDGTKFLEAMKKRDSGEAEFIDYHKTGHIREGTYEQYEKDLSWLKKSENPVLYKKVEIKGGEKLELRKSGEKLKYVKTDKSGEILRDNKGMALMQSDAEIKKKGLPTHDTCIVAFNSKGEAVGYASDEFGATGVYVLKEYQNKGLGLKLLTEYRKQVKPERRLGQMTPSGESLARKYYRTQVEKR